MLFRSLVVVHSVQHMKLHLQINVVWLAVLKTRFKEHKLVLNMLLTGRKVFMITVKPPLMIFSMFFNVLGETIDEDGNLIQWREFNTQVCEQLNAWLAGYESILK